MRFTIAPQPTADPKNKESVTQGQPVDLSYATQLGGPDGIGRLLWTEAQRCSWKQAADTQFLGDGALWIWNLAETYFVPHQQTVDWYHATHHLHVAAQAYHPPQENAAVR